MNHKNIFQCERERERERVSEYPGMDDFDRCYAASLHKQRWREKELPNADCRLPIADCRFRRSAARAALTLILSFLVSFYTWRVSK